MDSQHFEGTVVLERLAEIGKLDDFYLAIDSDDFAKAEFLLKYAEIDSETIAIVLQKMANADGEP